MMTTTVTDSSINSRTILLLGNDKFNKLKNSHVLIAGLGGVGGYAVEQLCRAGVGELTIVDADTVNESNINRQIIALTSTVGKSKTELFAQRIRDINPAIKLNIVKKFIKDDDISNLLQSNTYDYAIDAIDTLAPKVRFILECLNLNIPLVSAMGAGGKINPENIKVADIDKTYNCNLSRMVRKRLHRIGIRTGFKAVFSTEKIKKEAVIIEASENKKTNVGTISYMPAMFGLYCASEAINYLINNPV